MNTETLQQPSQRHDPAEYLSDEQLASEAYELGQKIHRLDEAHADKTEPLRQQHQLFSAEIMRRIQQNGGHALMHPRLAIEIQTPTILHKRIGVLRSLEGLVPADELRPALSLVQPEPEWRADGKRLNTLARKYGGKIAEIIRAGMPRLPNGQPRLLMREKEISR